MEVGVRDLDKKLTLADIENASLKAIELGVEKAFKAFYSLWSFFETMADTRKFDGGKDLIIICPDDGPHVAVRIHGRWCCPKCGGHSWHIAGLGYESYRTKFEPSRISKLIDRLVDKDETNVVEFPDESGKRNQPSGTPEQMRKFIEGFN